jgi:diguanylate cyclase (GGDEF)-like protein
MWRNVKITNTLADLKNRPLVMGYGAILLSLVLAAISTDHGLAAGFLVAVPAACAILFFASDHFRLAAENNRLFEEGATLHRKAHSDPLTGLMNRMAFRNALEDGRRNKTLGEVAVIFVDLNGFKQINDMMGHRVGDLLLVEVAKTLKEHLHHAYALARMGGDEFAAILPADGAVSPESCAIAITHALRNPFVLEGKMVQSGASVGISYGDLAHCEGGELLKRADLAMYDAKKNFANGFRVFDDNMQEDQSAKSNIRAELSNAMRNGEMELHFQPIFNARSGEMKSAEALLRWNSPSMGYIPPATLISIAEESGQIIDLSCWIIDQALAAAKALGDLPVGVNISPLHFRHTGFAAMLADKLVAANVPPQLLHLEITEGVLISHIEAAKRTLAQLREMGIQIYLDDFGTGYSSLSYLQNLEFDGVKIDKSFLRNLGERSQATQIMRSVIDLGHSLNMQVVAEGVESDWQARLLQLLNCDLLQGFHFATPMRLEEVQIFREAQQHSKTVMRTAQVLSTPISLHNTGGASIPSAAFEAENSSFR